MIKIFITVLNMSIAASMAIVVVLVLRLLLGRAPKIFSYLLWVAVVLRLLCPFMPQVSWGIIPSALFLETGVGRKGFEGDGQVQISGLLADDKGMEKDGQEGIIRKDAEKRGDMEAGKDEGSKIGMNFPSAKEEIWKKAAGIWLAAGSALLLYGIYGYLAFMGRAKKCGVKGKARDVQENKPGFGRRHSIITSREIEEPFVAGFFQPVIYLPAGLGQAQRELVTLHEEIHIVRRDYLVKAAAYLAVCLHWFNPLAWIAFYLMEQDMEASCDEMVLKKVGYEYKKEYARTLLYLSGRQGWKMGHPPAFGEKSVKVRIKNIMKYKGVKVWAAVAAFAVVLGAFALLLVNGSWGRDVLAAQAEGADMEKREAPDEETAEVAPGEIRYLPAEKIVTKESTGDGAASATDHNYYANEGYMAKDIGEGEIVNLPEEKITTSYTPLTDMEETAHEYMQAADHFDSLRRTAKGDGEEGEVMYHNPVETARIADDFGVRVHPVTQERVLHSGIDFAAELGTPVLAAADGNVFETGFDATAGNYVILQHRNGELTYYACCDEISVQEGESVAAGEQIATVGKTGRSSGAHLHFALSRDGSFINPVFTDSNQ